jgi:FkbM family methyltransferase
MHSILAKMFYGATAASSPVFCNIAEKWLELTSLRRFLTRYDINVVIDVGANEGQFAAKLRHLGYTGRIASFEPDPRAFKLLQHQHQADSKWCGYPIALGDAETELELNIAHHSVLSSFLTHVRAKNMSTLRVSVQRLDSLFDELIQGAPSPRVLLKTDTQGFDLAVLRGASGCMNRVTGILAELSVIPLYESSPAFIESIETYQKAGFDIVDLNLVNRTVDGRVLEYDGLFVQRPRDNSTPAQSS